MRGASLALSLVLLASAGAAHAQSLEDRLRSQLVAVNGRLQELQNSQASLVAQKTAAEAERDALKRRLAAAEGQARAARRDTSGPELARYRAQADQAALAKAQGDAELASARAEIERLTQQVRQEQAERQRATAGLEQARADAQAARAKNDEALAVAREVLDAYQKVGLADVMGRREPFTGLKRVQIETIAQGYEDRLHAARADAPPLPPSAKTQ